MEKITQITTDFIDYLKDKYGEEASKKIESYSPELSIFMYSNDFQKYLVNNGYADASIFSQSISEIKEMLASEETGETEDSAEDTTTDVNDGENSQNLIGDNFMLSALTEVVNNDEDLFSALNTNSNETIDIEEINAFLDSVDAHMQANPDEYETIFDGIAKGIQDIKGVDEELSVDELLESIYNSDAALEYLDLDGDGKISDEEKELFEKYVQGNKDELNAEDLQKALEEIENGTYKYDAKLPNKTEEDIPETEEKDDTSKVNNSPNVSSAAPSGGSYAPSGFSPSSTGSSGNVNNINTTPSDVNDMNLEQLKQEQSTRQTNVDNAKENVDTIVSDISDLENGEYAQAREAYDKAIENDKNIDDDLKKRRTDNLNEVETVNSDIASLNSQIADTQVSLGEANDKLDGDKKNLSALKSALDSYNSASSDNPEEQAEIDQAKQKLQNQINELEKTTIPNDEKECDRLDKLLNGGGESKGLKEQLEEKESSLETLETNKDNIEQEIRNIYKNNPESPTMQALEKFNETEEKLSALRDKLPQAQEELTTAQSELDEVNELIRTKEAEQTESENSYYSGSLPSALVSELDAKLGSGFCAKVEEVAKRINCDPKDLIGMMQSESGINPQAQNANGGATGLIQFMPSTAQALGTTTSELYNMNAIEQLDYVEQFFIMNTNNSGQRLTAGDLYTLCFLPAYINNEVLCSSSNDPNGYYSVNSGLDANKDGQITKTELGERVTNKYNELLSQYGLS